MADVKFKVVKFQWPAGGKGTTKDITLTGFGTVDAVMMFSTFSTTEFTNFTVPSPVEQSAHMSIGFASNNAGSPNITQRFASTRMTRQVGGTESHNWTSNIAIAGYIRYAAPLDLEAAIAIDAFITDGIRVVITAANTNDFISPSQEWWCTAIFIGGADVSNAYCDSYGFPTTSADITQDYTTPGFEPDLLFSMSVINGGGGNLNDTNTNAIGAFGIALNDGNDTQKSIGMYAQSNAPPPFNPRATAAHNDKAIWQLGNESCVISDFDANGFSATKNQDGGQTAIFLALKFANNPGIAFFDTEIPTAGDYAVSRPGFEPTFGLVVCDPSLPHRTRGFQDTPLDTGIAFNMFAFDDQATSPMNVSSMSLTAFRGDDTSPQIARHSVRHNLLGDLPVVQSDLDDETVGIKARFTDYEMTANGWRFTTDINPYPLPVLGFALAIGATAQASPIPETSPEAGLNGVGAFFAGNLIVSGAPALFDESPQKGSPANVAYMWAANLEQVQDNVFIAADDHAIRMGQEGAYTFQGNEFIGTWLDGTSPDGNGTFDAGVYNEVGQVVLNVVGGGNTPTTFDKQSPGTTINNNVSVTITNIQPLTEIRVYPAEDTTSPINTSQIAGTENVNSPTEFTFTAPAGILVDIVVHNIGYVLPPNNRIKNFVIPATDTTFPISQVPDRNFSNL